MNTQPFGSTQGEPDTHTRLHGRRLTIARTICIVLVILALATWGAGLSPRFNELRVPCAGEGCALLTLSPQEAYALGDAGLSLEFYAGYQVGFEIFSVVIHILLAGLLFWRRSDDRMALFVSVTLVMMATFVFSNNVQALAKLYPTLNLPINLLMALANVSFLLLFYLFPDGRFVPRWTRLLATILAAYALIASLLSEGLLFSTPGLLSTMAYILFLGNVGAGIFAQVYRYRRVSGPVQRQQTKWVVSGLCVLVLGIFAWVFAIELFPPPPGPARLYLSLAGAGAMPLLLPLLPLTLAIAILRYRLWDIDALINRTMVYGALTGALALVYFGSVVLLQGLFRALTGQESQLAVVASTLAIAGLFLPLRRRIQDAIDRRFYRRKYDAEQVLAAFAETARDETDLDRLTDELLAVVEETMQPAHVSLWLKPAADTSAESTLNSVEVPSRPPTAEKQPAAVSGRKDRL